MAESEAPAAPAKAEPNHWLRILLIWIVLALVADLLDLDRPEAAHATGDMTSAAEHEQFDIAVLAMAAARS